MLPRVVLLTQPKAGTYLISEILRRLGWRQTYYHLRLDSLDAYDGRQLEEGRRHPQRYRAEIPIEEAAKLIRSGEFGVGHLPCCDRAAGALGEFRLIFAQREQRAALVSCMRFQRQAGRPVAGRPGQGPQEWTVEFLRESGPKLIEQARAALPWADHPGVLALRFEGVCADPAAAAAQIAAHLGLGRPGEEIARGLAAADTLTRSATPTALEDYWSDRAEAVFAELGGPELNAAAGYPSETPALA